jgi:hypothetical protein
LLCLQLFLHRWNFALSLRLAGPVRETHTENDITFSSFRTSKNAAGIILSADITSRLAGSVSETVWDQDN